jgi:hypothetical protein
MPMATIVPTPTTLMAAGNGVCVATVANANRAAAQTIWRVARTGGRK